MIVLDYCRKFIKTILKYNVLTFCWFYKFLQSNFLDFKHKFRANNYIDYHTNFIELHIFDNVIPLLNKDIDYAEQCIAMSKIISRPVLAPDLFVCISPCPDTILFTDPSYSLQYYNDDDRHELMKYIEDEYKVHFTEI